MFQDYVLKWVACTCIVLSSLASDSAVVGPAVIEPKILQTFSHCVFITFDFNVPLIKLVY